MPKPANTTGANTDPVVWRCVSIKTKSLLYVRWHVLPRILYRAGRTGEREASIGAGACGGQIRPNRCTRRNRHLGRAAEIPVIIGNPYLIALRQSCSSSRRNNLLTAAETDPACSILPRAPHGVTRDSCSVFLASGEQFPSNQPAHRSLRRTLRKSNRLGQLLITHLNGSLPTCLFGRKPYIDKEAGGSPVVADQVAHQLVYDVIIQVQHGYTGQ